MIEYMFRFPHFAFRISHLSHHTSGQEKDFFQFSIEVLSLSFLHIAYPFSLPCGVLSFFWAVF